MGNWMGYKVVRDIGRGVVIILAGKLHGCVKRQKIGRGNVRGLSFWSGSWKGSINRPKYVIIGTGNGRVTTRGPRHTGVK